MVKGMDSFREWFSDFESNYVIIGGTACDLLMGEAGESFRATRDIDMVLIIESLDTAFGSRIWEYVKMAGYEQRLKSSGEPEYYRFIKPRSSEFPAMIELFSRRAEGITLPPNAILTPLPVDDEVSSLSAILLNDDYYNFLRAGVTTVDGIPIIGAAHLISFKAKAWLDLTERKAQGGQVDSQNIRKHKNDIIRLTTLLSPDFRMDLPDTVADDMKLFLTKVDEPEKFVLTAVALNLSDAIPLDKLPLSVRLAKAKHRADIHNANLDSEQEKEPDID